MPSFRRSNNNSNSSSATRSSAPVQNANPDHSLPPPPPYIPVDRTSSSRPSAAQQALAHDNQPIYSPPSGPPPGSSQPAHAQAQVQSQASYPPANYDANRPPQSNNPFADHHSNSNSNSNSDLSAYPAMQPSQSPLPNPPSNAIGNQPLSTSPTSNSFREPARQGSVSAHARRMSEEFSNLSMGNQSPVGASAGSMRRSSKEDPLEFLKSFDTIFIVDDSSSMNVNEQPDGSMGRSRWEECRDALCGIVELASKYDDDGCDIHFLNDSRCLENCREPQKVRQLFDQIEPEGITETGTKLEMLLLQYLDDIETYKELKAKGDTKGMKEPKKRNYIVLTDGAASDDPESVIVSIARRLDAGKFPLSQIGISFIQVGDDAEAKEALEELDDALAKEHGIRDMVDTTTYNGMVLSSDMVVKALLGGVNRRMDKKKNTLA